MLKRHCTSPFNSITFKFSMNLKNKRNWLVVLTLYNSMMDTYGSQCQKTKHIASQFLSLFQTRIWNEIIVLFVHKLFWQIFQNLFRSKNPVNLFVETFFKNEIIRIVLIVKYVHLFPRKFFHLFWTLVYMVKMVFFHFHLSNIWLHFCLNKFLYQIMLQLPRIVFF